MVEVTLRVTVSDVHPVCWHLKTEQPQPMSVSVLRSFTTGWTSRTPSSVKKHLVFAHADPDSERDLPCVFRFKTRADTPALSELAGTWKWCRSLSASYPCESSAFSAEQMIKYGQRVVFHIKGWVIWSKWMSSAAKPLWPSEGMI